MRNQRKRRKLVKKREILGENQEKPWLELEEHQDDAMSVLRLGNKIFQ